jgi:hypothetical protein
MTVLSLAKVKTLMALSKLEVTSPHKLWSRQIQVAMRLKSRKITVLFKSLMDIRLSTTRVKSALIVLKSGVSGTKVAKETHLKVALISLCKIKWRLT